MPFLLQADPSFASTDFPISGKPVSLILPSSGGGTGDRLLRLFAELLTDTWKTPVVVEAKPGASGVVGTLYAVNAPPDGHTILLGYSHLTQSYAFNQKRPYDGLTDLIPLSRICDLPLVFLTGETDCKTMAEFTATMKKRKSGYGSYGNATTSHIYLELINKKHALQMVHAPYKGTGPLMTDLLGKQVQAALIDLGTALSHVQSGRMNALAITGNQRSSLLPNVPTFAELGHTEVSQPGRYWLMVPKGTPTPVAKKVQAGILNALADPKMQEAMRAMGLEPGPTTPEDISAQMREDVVYWKRVIGITGITTQD